MPGRTIGGKPSRDFEVNASQDTAVRASCVAFFFAGLYAADRISRSPRHGKIT